MIRYLVAACLALSLMAAAEDRGPLNDVSIGTVKIGSQMTSLEREMGPPVSTKYYEADITCQAGLVAEWPHLSVRFKEGPDGVLRAISVRGRSVEKGSDTLRQRSDSVEVLNFLKGIDGLTVRRDPGVDWKEIIRCYGHFNDTEGNSWWVSLEAFVDQIGFHSAILTLRNKGELEVPWPTFNEYQLRDPGIFRIPTF